MSLFRSEDMGLFTLSLEKNFAYEIMDSLGKLSCLHFIDVSNKDQVYSKPYSAMIRRCDEAIRKIKYIEALCEKHNKPLKAPLSVDTFLTNMQQMLNSKGIDSMAYFEEVEAILESSEKFLGEQQKNAEKTFRDYTSVVQHRYVLNKASEIVLSRGKY